MAVRFDNNNNSDESFDDPKNYPPITLPPLQTKIEYHFRDNTFHFIFDVSNKFLSGKSRLTIEVPRVKLENIKLPDMKEIYVNQWYINIFINTLIFSINEGSYTLTGV